MAERADVLLTNITTLLTLDEGPVPRRGAAAGNLGKLVDGAVAIRDGAIVAVGASKEVAARFEAPDGERWDLRGCTVLPGFVDAHTHVLFAGSREAEFEMRLDGRSYMEIAAAGGGINASVRAFREADDEQLIGETRRRLDRMLAHGTTTIEAKSGYGLDTAQELRALRLIDLLDAGHPIDLHGTLLGAHDFPPEYRERRAEYIRLIVEEMIPRAAGETRARFCDVFCEKGVFTVEEARVILVAARAHGLAPRMHADEFAPSGASELAAELGALSADHLMAATDDGLRALAGGRTVAVLLPGTSFSIGKRGYAPARKMIELGLPIALATDCNPGSSMTTNMRLIIALAVLEMKLTVAEAITAVTVNPAHSLGLADTIGRLATGFRADLQVLRGTTPAGIPYELGGGYPMRVMKLGRWVAAEGATLS
jgi:imidazolonepropionase